MGKYGGDLTDYGQTGSLFLKNLEATYKRPKNEFETQHKEIDIDALSFEEIQSLVPDNWHDDSSDFWPQQEEVFFNCKDGQTNAYVKRGTDEQVEEYMDRQETSVLVWHVATDNNHVKFLAGGKVRVKGADWFILKVIQQDSAATYANRYFAMTTDKDNDRLRLLGLKTLVLIGGIE